jgi:RHS repeat-associated protein
MRARAVSASLPSIVLLLSAPAAAGVGDVGDYQTSVALEVPEYYGLEPSLSLAYSSSGGNGPAGIGWRLAAGSTIRRQSMNGGAPRYDGTDRFFVDGRELVGCGSTAEPSAVCSAGATHVFRVDTYQLVTQNPAVDPVNGGNTWTITDRDGTARHYIAQLGKTDSADLTYAWALSRVTDRLGRSVHYDYVCDGGACYPDEIRYGDGVRCMAGQDQPAGTTIEGGKVRFTWEARPDVLTVGTGRGFETVRSRLKRVDMFHGADRVRAYVLEYGQVSGSNMSVIRELRELGRDNVTPGPSRRFEYPSLQASMSPIASTTSSAGGTFVLGPSVATPPALLPVWTGLAAAVPRVSPADTRYGDFDGDGRIDFLVWWVEGDCSKVTLRVRLAGALSDTVSIHQWTSNHPNGWPLPPTCAGAFHVADLDGNGMQDLIVENWTHGPVNSLSRTLQLVTLLSTGGGSFAPPSQEHLSSVGDNLNAPSACGVGDLNGDGLDDFGCVMLPGATFSTVSLLSQGDGGFHELVGPGPADFGIARQLQIADMNRDGIGDLVVAATHSGSTNQPPGNCFSSGECPHWRISIGISNGSGTYSWEQQDTTLSTMAALLPEIFAAKVMIADLDGDQRRDLVIAVQSARATEIDVLRNTGSGPTRWTSKLQVIDGLTWDSQLFVGDADGDAIAELLVGFRHKNTNNFCGDVGIQEHYETRSLPLQADDTFFSVLALDPHQECGQRLAQSTWPYITGAAAMDVDGDGRTDWIAIDQPNPNMWVIADVPAIHRNRSKRAWRRADVDGDGREDWAAVTFANPGLEIALVRTLADGSLSRTTTSAGSAFGESTTADSARDWHLADVGGPAGVPDGKTDVVVVDDRAGVVTTFLADGGGGWTRRSVAHGLAVRRTARQWIAIDHDGNGTADLVRLEPFLSRTGQSSTSVFVLRSLGDGTWSPSTHAAFVGGPTPRLTAFRGVDLDGDRRGDLVQVTTQLRHDNPGRFTTTIRTLRSNGDGTFAGASQAIVQVHPDDGYLVTDMNGDGRGDLARVDFPTGPTTPIVTYLLGIGNGRFEGPAIQGVGGAPVRPGLGENRAFTPADLNEDGRTDFFALFAEVDTSGTRTTSLQVVWNSVGGFTAAATAGLVLPGVDTPNFQLDDSGSDGRPDLVRMGNTLDRILLAAPANRLVAHGNGTGGRIAIDYATSVGLAGNLPAGVVLPVVRRTRTIDDTSGLEVEATTYAYRGPTYDHGRGTMLGFAAADALGTRSKVTTTYQLDDRCGARPTRAELFDVAGTPIARTHFTFLPDSSTGAAPFACHVVDTVKEECEGSPSCRVTAEHAYYDDYGNVHQVWEEGSIEDATDDRWTIMPVRANTEEWVVDAPAYRMVYGQADLGGGTWSWQALEHVEYLYDNATDAQTPATVGLLTAQRRWNDQTGRWIVSSVAYDPRGNAVMRVGPPTPHAPFGEVETIAYDCDYNRFPETVCDGVGCTAATWDKTLGQRRTSTDVNGGTTVFTYDAFGRVVQMDQPDGGFVAWEHPDWTPPHGAQHERMSVSDGSPNDGVYWTDTLLDGLGRPWRTMEEGGRVTDVQYDGASQRDLATSNPYLVGDPIRWTRRTYDAADRLTASTTPDGRSRRNIYDVGTLTMIDEVGATTIARTDGFGRTVAVTEILRTCFNGGDTCPVDERHVTTYGWDALDRSIWIRDAKGNFTTSRYDSLSNRLEACSPDRGCETVEYADDGLPLFDTDANGSWHRMQYDHVGREILRTSSDATGASTRTVETAWDVDPATGLPAGASIGRVVKIVDTSRVDIVRRRSYDPMGRVSAQEDCVLGACVSMGHVYDDAGRIAEITYPDSTKVSYVYDHRGLLVAIPGHAMFLYDDATRLPTRTVFWNGVQEERAFDPQRFWIDEIELTAAGGGFRQVIGHDAVGRVRSIAFARPAGSVSTTYDYDDLGRLRVVHSTDPALAAVHDYDGIGNMVLDSVRGTIDYTSAPHPHAPTATGAGGSFTYDALGQVRTSGTRTIDWNEDGNPIRVRDAASGVATEYAYDVDGQRVMRASGAGVELVFNPLASLDTNGGYVGHVVAHGQAIARVDSKGTTYLHRDHLGSVRAITDAGGATVDERDYGTWGERRAPFAVTSIVDAFTGALAEDDHELLLLGSRYFDPIQRVFLSADTIVPDMYAPQTLNPYAYVVNNPATYVDPDGHEPRFYADPNPEVASLGVGLDLTDDPGEIIEPEELEPEPSHRPTISLPAEEGFFRSIVSGNSEPSFGKSLIPVIGSAQSAIYHFHHGNYVRGGIYTALAISDLFLAGTIVKGVGKVAMRGGIRLLGRQFLEGSRRLLTGNWRRFGETARLLFGRSKYGVKELFWNNRIFDKVSAQHWRGTANELGISLQHLWVMNCTKLPPWMQGFKAAGFNLLEVPARFNHWMGKGVSNQVFRLAVRTGLNAELQAVYSGTQAALGLRDPPAAPSHQAVQAPSPPGRE